jgi:hypothetical protein
MKRIVFAITAAVLGIFFSLAFSAAQVQESKEVFTLSEGIGTGQVLGIHILSLKKDVQPAQFEKFIVEEWAPVIQDIFPGMKIMVMKGERGSRINQYILAYDISSLYVRNFYVPKPGQSSEIATQIIQACGDKCGKLQQRFEQMVDRPEWTDYVALVKR